MRTTIALALLACLAASVPASARQALRNQGAPASGFADPGGRAPWNQSWEYDSGGGNDRRPELPFYQQGRGQQTGGPARNLLPDDGLRLFPY